MYENLKATSVVVAFEICPIEQRDRPGRSCSIAARWPDWKVDHGTHQNTVLQDEHSGSHTVSASWSITMTLPHLLCTGHLRCSKHKQSGQTTQIVMRLVWAISAETPTRFCRKCYSISVNQCYAHQGALGQKRAQLLSSTKLDSRASAYFLASGVPAQQWTKCHKTSKCHSDNETQLKQHQQHQVEHGRCDAAATMH